MQFEYLYQVQATGFIDIENIGECCLLATNDFYEEFVFIIHTEYGDTKILQYGPVIVDTGKPVSKLECIYTNIEFNEGKIIKTIERFLSNPKYNISQVIEISYEEARDKIKNLVEFL